MNKNKSLMKTLKRNGPNIEPREHPWSILSKIYGDLRFSLFDYDLLNNQTPCGY